MGQGIKLLQSGLIPFPKKQIDICLIWVLDGVHRDVCGSEHLYLFCSEEEI